MDADEPQRNGCRRKPCAGTRKWLACRALYKPLIFLRPSYPFQEEWNENQDGIGLPAREGLWEET